MYWKQNLLFSLTALLIATTAYGQNAKILGVWWNEEKTSRIEVFEYHGKIYGKVIWLKDEKNPNGSHPRTDYNNPDEKLRKRHVVGIQILKHLHWDEYDKAWEDGEIYDPKTGKTYSCFAKLQKDGTLYLKGYVLGMTMIGKSTVWTRYK